MATAFAGFTGIVVVLGRRGRGEWRSTDLAAVAILLTCSLAVVFFGFVPDLARAAHLSPAVAWRVSTFLFAAYHLVVILGGWRARRQALARGEAPLTARPVEMMQFAGGGAIVSLQFVTAAGLLSEWLFFFYLLGLLWMLGMATFAFAVLLVDASSSPPPS